MKILWICGLPNEVRISNPLRTSLSDVPTPAWSWIIGHLPPVDGVELHFACPVIGLIRDRVDFDYLGAHWHCFRQKKFELLFGWIRMRHAMRQLVKAENFNVIHGWGGETGCGWLATLLSCRAVVSVQGLLLLFWQMLNENGVKLKMKFNMRLQFLIERLTYRRARLLMTESETSRENLIHYYSCNAVVVPQPLRKEFLDGNVPEKIITNGHINIVFVGQLCDRKGPVDAVRALVKLADAYDFSFVIIGDGAQGDEIDNLVHANGMSSKVMRMEHCSAEKIRDVMAMSQIFLLPSYGDTGPTSLKEAISQACYPVCYDNTGPHEFVTKYIGKLAATGNVDDLAQKLKEAFEIVLRDANVAYDAAVAIRHELSSENVWKLLIENYKKVNLDK